MPTKLVIPPDSDDPDNPNEVAKPLLPAPVKTVLRCGYNISNGYLYCEIPYTKLTGLKIIPNDHEF